MDLRDRACVVVGGGFFGCSVALELGRLFPGNVLLLEAGDSIMLRASQVNQARLHGGYHYPRSFLTASRSRANLGRFLHDWDEAVVGGSEHVYAVARNNSKVSPEYLKTVCQRIGAPLKRPSPVIESMLNPSLIRGAFVVDEYLFNANILRDEMFRRLNDNGITLLCNAEVVAVEPRGGHNLEVTYRHKEKEEAEDAHLVFNCTYSRLNRLRPGHAGPVMRTLKHEIAEIAYVDVPEQLENVALTVIDGAFFSVMPNPIAKKHSLSHVRYTPHLQWVDKTGVDPYAVLASYHRESSAHLMLRDASRYLPALKDASYRYSEYEVKTVVMSHEPDDGRPIVFDKSSADVGYYAVLGGKIDNVYDILDAVKAELAYKFAAV